MRGWISGLVLVTFFLTAAGCASQGDKPAQVTETGEARSRVLDLARSVISDVRYATLVTVGAEGQPRTRIVDAFAPDETFVIHVATNPKSRKVRQIRGNHRVTLFYYDTEGQNYVSVMGRATLVDDNDVKRRMRREADLPAFYPEFPDDYLLIRIEPEWLEGLLPGYRGDPDTWAPVRVEF